jgi:hypothetical protein
LLGVVTDELADQPTASLVVSTIHRAKGLEFDRVMLADPPDYLDRRDEIEIAENCRLLYVALTRPKRELYHLQVPNCPGLRRDAGLNRRVAKDFRGRITDVEIRPGDIDDTGPDELRRYTGCDPSETQEYLRNEVRAGSAVSLVRTEHRHPDSEAPRYVVRHGGRTVGVTSAGFAWALSRLFGRRSGQGARWPSSFDAISVECVETVAGLGAETERAGLGVAPFWLQPRVSGLARVVF